MTPVPSTWTWRDGPVRPGECVVVDIDGVIADALHRQHLLQGYRAWDEFFEAAGEDDLIEEVAQLVGLLRSELTVVLLTARPMRIRDLTVAWLLRHEVRWDLLVMRDDHDYSPAAQLKRAELEGLREHGFEVQLAVDDDPRNVAMFRRAGVHCLEIHSGYHG